MKNRSSCELYTYWDSVRNGRFAPNRFEIEPSSISDLLPDVFILELPDNATYRFRLAGTRICTTLGQEMRGVNLLDFWEPEEREALQSLLHCVAMDGAGAVVEFTCDNADNESVEFELLVLPLVHTGETVTRMIGSLSASENHYWLGNTQLSRPKLKSFNLVWPNLQPNVADDTPALQTSAQGSAQSPLELRQRFRVVEGGLSRHSK